MTLRQAQGKRRELQEMKTKCITKQYANGWVMVKSGIYSIGEVMGPARLWVKVTRRAKAELMFKVPVGMKCVSQLQLHKGQLFKIVYGLTKKEAEYEKKQKKANTNL